MIEAPRIAPRTRRNRNLVENVANERRVQGVTAAFLAGPGRGHAVIE